MDGPLKHIGLLSPRFYIVPLTLVDTGCVILLPCVGYDVLCLIYALNLHFKLRRLPFLFKLILRAGEGGTTVGQGSCLYGGRFLRLDVSFHAGKLELVGGGRGKVCHKVMTSSSIYWFPTIQWSCCVVLVDLITVRPAAALRGLIPREHGPGLSGGVHVWMQGWKRHFFARLSSRYGEAYGNRYFSERRPCRHGGAELVGCILRIRGIKSASYCAVYRQ